MRGDVSVSVQRQKAAMVAIISLIHINSSMKLMIFRHFGFIKPLHTQVNWPSPIDGWLWNSMSHSWAFTFRNIFCNGRSGWRIYPAVLLHILFTQLVICNQLWVACWSGSPILPLSRGPQATALPNSHRSPGSVWLFPLEKVQGHGIHRHKSTKLGLRFLQTPKTSTVNKGSPEPWFGAHWPTMSPAMARSQKLPGTTVIGTTKRDVFAVTCQVARPPVESKFGCAATWSNSWERPRSQFGRQAAVILNLIVVNMMLIGTVSIYIYIFQDIPRCSNA